ncbi:hypothetical protein BDZ89DRAFT_1223551 [Hymenopellis radicata]|nr:hypothetical protein BDZ89DRAFT_1223551 [Hymenopellis radicata]
MLAHKADSNMLVDADANIGNMRKRVATTNENSVSGGWTTRGAGRPKHLKCNSGQRMDYTSDESNASEMEIDRWNSSRNSESDGGEEDEDSEEKTEDESDDDVSHPGSATMQNNSLNPKSFTPSSLPVMISVKPSRGRQDTGLHCSLQLHSLFFFAMQIITNVSFVLLWIARPPHSNQVDGFKHASRFKKECERHGEGGDGGKSALQMVCEEVYEENGQKWRPWTTGGKGICVEKVEMDCFRDAAREPPKCSSTVK